MGHLLERALNDPLRPKTMSLKTSVSAYPVALGPEHETLLPAERLLQGLGVEPTDEPFKDDALFGKDKYLRRYEGGSPASVADNNLTLQRNRSAIEDH